MPLSIAEFPRGEESWRIDWMCTDIVRSPNIESEPKVAIHLTQLKPNYKNPLLNSSITSVSATCMIGIGQLGLTTIGSVWENRKLVVTPETIQSTTINRQACEWVKFDDQINVHGITVSVIAKSSYRVNSYEQIKGAYLIRVKNGLGRPDWFIPAVEVLRACACLSSQMAKAIANGSLEQIIQLDECGWVDDDTYKVYLMDDIKNEHAHVIADWVATKEGRLLFQTIKRSIVASLQHSDGSNSKQHCRYRFPGIGPIVVAAAGKNIPLVKDSSGKVLHWGFLVTRIVSWDTKLPFQRLVIDRINNNHQGKNKDDPDLIKIYKQSAPKTPTHDLTLISSSEPDKRVSKQELAAYQVVFGRTHLKTVHEEKEIQRFRSITLKRTACRDSGSRFFNRRSGERPHGNW